MRIPVILYTRNITFTNHAPFQVINVTHVLIMSELWKPTLPSIIHLFILADLFIYVLIIITNNILFFKFFFKH